MKTSCAEPLLTRDGSAETAALERAGTAAEKLYAYCRASDWAGYDPYDALNSRIFEALPASDHEVASSTVYAGVEAKPDQHQAAGAHPENTESKGHRAVSQRFLNLRRAETDVIYQTGQYMLECLKAQRSPDTRYWCWGYSFPWQTRGDVVPRGSPNLVCTTFVANALLDLYKQRPSSECLEMAVSAADYILTELYWTTGDTTAGFAYPLPSAKAQVHNANFLARCPRANSPADWRYQIPRPGAQSDSALCGGFAQRRVVGLRRACDPAVGRRPFTRDANPCALRTIGTEMVQTSPRDAGADLPRIVRRSSGKTARRDTSSTKRIRLTFIASLKASSRSLLCGI